MIIGLTGGTGFIGQEVQRAASEQRDEVILFSRRPSSGMRTFSSSKPLDVSGCEGLVHLAGEPIVGIWTREKRVRILESRVEGTRRLVEGIEAAIVKPRVLVSASAIGFDGDTGGWIASEDSPAGKGFLAEVAQAWEAEAQKAESFGVRVVRLRIGLVIGRNGGAMKLISTIFRIGLGGRLGSGEQWMSCIAVEDLAGMILQSLHNNSIKGAINAVMPEPVTNLEFTRLVARGAHRPAIIPTPAFALRLALGDLSHLLLDSQRISPKRFLELGFPYCCRSVGMALDRIFQSP